MEKHNTIKPTYGQVLQTLNTELDLKGIDPKGLCRNGFDLDVANSFSNFLSVAKEKQHEPLDRFGEKLFEECEKAIRAFEERQSGSSIEELL